MAQLPILTLSDVCLSLGGKPLFEGVTLTLARGERAALVGRNGAGKSTLMRIINGQTDPDSGQALPIRRQQPWLVGPARLPRQGCQGRLPQRSIWDQAGRREIALHKAPSRRPPGRAE